MVHHAAPLCRPSAALVLLALTACAGKDGADTAGDGVRFTPTSLDFGEVPLGGSLALDILVQNGTTAEVDILSAALVEGRSVSWDIARADEGPIAPLGTTSITVTFLPFEQGPEAGRLQVRTTDPSTGTSFITLAGVATASVTDEDGDGVSPADGDCNDGNAAVYPGAEELCDGLDNDCDGRIPDAEDDDDYDGVRVCSGDCDDDDANVRPGAREVCDDKDTDCDGLVEDYIDADGDGQAICDDCGNDTLCDCDDAEPLVYRGAAEACDLLDNDCSGGIDDIDLDGDGHSPCAGGGDCDDRDRLAFPVIVDPNEPEDGDGTLESPYASLESGLANLDAVCRTVVLLPGTYEASFAWTDGDLQINGGGDTPGAVILTPPVTDDGAPTGRILEVSNGATVALVNLTLRGSAAGGDGGAIRVVSADLTLDGVVATGNTSGGDGGAVALSAGTLNLRGARFENNRADDDGGAISLVSGALFDEGSTFVNNTGAQGGAVFAASSAITLWGSTFDDNGAQVDGGAFAASGAAAFDVWGARFTRNTAAGEGGAWRVVDVDADSVVRNSLFLDNRAGTAGGAVELTGNRARIGFANNTFACNEAGGEGADVRVDVPDAGGFWFWSNVFAFSTGDSGLWMLPAAGGSVAYNLGFATSSGLDYSVDPAQDDGYNRVENPSWADYSCAVDDDFGLTTASPARNTGPEDGEGPPGGPTVWADPDGTRNDRGLTGGPEAL